MESANEEQGVPCQARANDGRGQAPPVALNQWPRLISGNAAASRMQVSLACLLEQLGGDVRSLEGGECQSFAVRRVARGAMLAHQGAIATALFAVQVGSFKCVKTADDGIEQVLGFCWPSDAIGLEALGLAYYAYGAVALEDSRVMVLPLAGLDALRSRVSALDATLQCLMANQLIHIGEIAEVMASVAADVRLARFLVQLSGRMAARGQSAHRLLLRMSRRDIANHLGVAHETISRSLRALVDGGWLRVHEREVEILDLEGLKQCARSPRGLNERPASESEEPEVPVARRA